MTENIASNFWGPEFLRFLALAVYSEVTRTFSQASTGFLLAISEVVRRSIEKYIGLLVSYYIPFKGLFNLRHFLRLPYRLHVFFLFVFVVPSSHHNGPTPPGPSGLMLRRPG